MMGLVLIAVFGLYLLVSLGVVIGVVAWARRNNRRVWLWGIISVLVMYNSLFWDWIPTVVAHNYYCAKDAGFTINKTLEEWKRENPRVLETLKRSLEPVKVEEVGGVDRYWLTQRFYSEVKYEKLFHSLSVTEKKFFDAETKELIAYAKNYYKGKSGNVLSLGGGSLDDIRQALIFGWGERSCLIKDESPSDIFDKYVYKYWKSGEGK